jgi:hypothetical protein
VCAKYIFIDHNDLLIACQLTGARGVEFLRPLLPLSRAIEGAKTIRPGAPLRCDTSDPSHTTGRTRGATPRRTAKTRRFRRHPVEVPTGITFPFNVTQ